MHFTWKVRACEERPWTFTCRQLASEVAWAPHPIDETEMWFTHGWCELAFQLQIIEGDIIAVELMSVSKRKIRVTVFPLLWYI